MCGIIGAAVKAQNGFYSSSKDVVEQLLYIDALRGPDSTGLACFFNDGSMQLLKDTSEAAYFRYDNDVIQCFKDLVQKGKAVIGHNRKKTVGDIDEASAHPFTINNRYLFVHNGTLNNVFSLEKELDNDVVLQTKVDSEVLGNLLCPLSQDKKAMEEMLSKVYGAYACVWIDQKEEKLYMVRNKERPLYLAETSDGYFWASEPMFLGAACSRNRVVIDKVTQIDEDCLYSIDLSTHALTLVKEGLTIKKATPVSTKGTGKTNGGKNTTADTNPFRDGVVSKKAFKKFYKQWIGAIGTFYVDDYVERTVGDWKSGWWVWGTDDDCYGLPHQVRALVEPMNETALIYQWGGSVAFGRISQITQDPETGMPIMMMTRLSHSREGVIKKEQNEEHIKVH